MVQMAKFGPFPAPQVVQDGPDWTPSIHFLLGINVALVNFVLKSISEAVGAQDGQVWAISGPHMVQDGPDWTPSIRFILGINVALVKFVLKSICEDWDGPDGKFRAIADPVWF